MIFSRAGGMTRFAGGREGCGSDREGEGGSRSARSWMFDRKALRHLEAARGRKGACGSEAQKGHKTKEKDSRKLR